MSAANALEKYTRAMGALQDHQDAHEPIFKEHQKLVFAVIDAENDLRDEVAESKSPISNEAFRVTITPQTMEVADFDKIRELGAKGVDITGIITTQERPPRINIAAQRPVKDN